MSDWHLQNIWVKHNKPLANAAPKCAFFAVFYLRESPRNINYVLQIFASDQPTGSYSVFLSEPATIRFYVTPL